MDDEDIDMSDFNNNDNNSSDGEEDVTVSDFNDKPKFDANLDVDEDEDPKKYIQKLSGKLGQKIREYPDLTGEVDPKLEKFAVNSVISSLHLDNMDDSDINDISKKLTKDDADVVPSSDDNNNMENNTDTNDSEQLNESRNLENYLLSLFDKNLTTKKDVTMTEKEIEKPSVAPVITEPVTQPRRRSPYNPKPRVKPLPKMENNG